MLFALDYNKSDSLKVQDIKKTSTLLTLARFLQLPLSLATSIVVARRLGPEGRGILTLVLQIPSVILICAHFGVGMSSSYSFSKKLLDAPTLARSMNWFSFVSGALLIGCMTAGFPWLQTNLLRGVTWQLYLLAISFIPFQLSIQNHGPLMMALGQAKTQIAVNLCHSILVLALTSIGLLALHPHPTSAVAALVFSVLVTWLFMYWRSLRPLFAAPAQNNPWQVIRGLLPYGKWYQISDLIQFINYRFDLFLVNYWLTKADVGFYSLAFVLAETLRIIPTSIATVLFPSLTALSPNEAKQRVPWIFRRLLVISVTSTAAFALLARPLVEICYSEKFLPALPAVFLILPGMAFICVASPFSIYLGGQGYIRLPILSSAIAAVVTITLDVVLIPRLGIEGAAIASSTSYMTLVITLIYFYLKVTQTRLLELFRFQGDEFEVFKQAFDVMKRFIVRG